MKLDQLYALEPSFWGRIHTTQGCNRCKSVFLVPEFCIQVIKTSVIMHLLDASINKVSLLHQKEKKEETRAKVSSF